MDNIEEELRKEISKLELGFMEGWYDICAIKKGHTHLLPTGVDKIITVFNKKCQERVDKEMNG